MVGAERAVDATPLHVHRHRRELMMERAELLYGASLIVALLLNGVAVAGAAPLADLLSPLRERRLLVTAFLVDVLVLPASVIGTALLLGLDDSTRTGLIIVMAASTGPIGMALVRILRAEVRVAVSIIALFGASNLVTVPALLWLLVPDAVHVPVGDVVVTLLALVTAPLLLGWSLRTEALRRGMTAERIQHLASRVGSASTLALAIAVAFAASMDLRGVLTFITSAAVLTVPVALIASHLAISRIAGDPRRRVALWISLNARAGGLSLSIAALHLPDVPGVRATILGYLGATQLLPFLIARATQRRWLGSVDAGGA
jgi:bile acid:Na+ symporter, BASS family